MGRVVDRTLNSVIGARIKSLRVERQLSQSEVAAVLNVAWQQIQKYENGTSCVTIAAMRKIASLFGVSPCDICQCCTYSKGKRRDAKA